MTALYRLRNAEGQLLYVGISDWPFERLMQHEKQRWIEQVRTADIEWYDTRAAAADAEICAIRNEHPTHNRQGLGGPRSRRLTPDAPTPTGDTERLVRHG